MESRPRRFQFSLRTLLAASLLAGATMLIWRLGWHPWSLARDFPRENAQVRTTGARIEGFSPDGTLFFTNVLAVEPNWRRHGIELIDTGTWQTYAQLLAGNQPVHWVEFSPDGQHLWAASSERVVQWHIPSETIEREWTGQFEPLWRARVMAFPRVSSDGRSMLLFPKNHEELTLCDTATGAELFTFPRAFSGEMMPQFSPGGSCCCALVARNAAWPGKFVFADVDQRKLVREVQLPQGNYDVCCCAFISETCFAWIEAGQRQPWKTRLHQIDLSSPDAEQKTIQLPSGMESKSMSRIAKTNWFAWRFDVARGDGFFIHDLLTGARVAEAPIERNIFEDAIQLTPTGHLITVNVEQLAVWDIQKNRALFRAPTPQTEVIDALAIPQFHTIKLDPTGRYLSERHYNGVRIWQRNHPEDWWGIVWLPQAWLGFALSILFMWSIARDHRPNSPKLPPAPPV